MHNELSDAPVIMIAGDAVWDDATPAGQPTEYVVTWQGRGFRVARHLANTPKAVYDAYRAHPPADLDRVAGTIDIALAAQHSDWQREQLATLAPHPTPLPGQPDA